MALRLSSRSRSPRESQGNMRSPTSEETQPLLASSNETPVVVPSQVGAAPTTALVQRTRCRRCCYNRIPKGKASLLVFILNAMETFAFYGAVDGIIRLVLGKESTQSVAYALSIALENTAGRLFYPLTGFLADAYLGRYKMIHVSLWLLWIAFALLAFSLSLNVVSDHPVVLVKYILPVTAFVFVCLGSAGFEANVIPFGIDQLAQGASSDEMSSYFYWYFAAKQLGALAGITTFIALFLPSYTSQTSTLVVDFETSTVSAVQPLIAVFVMSVAILLHLCFKHWYFSDSEKKNPVKLVFKVLFYAAFARRQTPIHRRAFRYGEERKPRMELAKEEYDGNFSSEEVEDVKTFCRIVLVLFSLSGCFAAYNAAYVMLSNQLYRVFGEIFKGVANPRLHNYVFPTLYPMFDAVMVLVYLPLLNHLILPCFPFTTMKERLGIGVGVNIIASAIAALLEWLTQQLDVSSEHKLLWLLIPVALLALTELLIFVTGLEFIYAQSPDHMRGLLTGLFYFTFGLCSGGGAFIFYRYPVTSSLTSRGIDCILWYYVGCTIIAGFGFVLYGVVAVLYTNRRRPAPSDDTDHMRIIYQTQQY